MHVNKPEYTNEHASFWRVLALEAFGGALRGPRTAGSASRLAKRAAFQEERRRPAAGTQENIIVICIIIKCK